MKTAVEQGELGAIPSASGSSRSLSSALALTSVALFACAWSAIVFGRHGIAAEEWAPIVIVLAWTITGTVVSVRLAREQLGSIALVASLIGAVALLATAIVKEAGEGRELAEVARPLAGALLPPAAMHLLLALPDGFLPRARDRLFVTLGYVTGAAVGIALSTQRPSLPVWPILLEAVIAGLVGVAGSKERYRRSRGIDRQRMQWVGLGITVAAEIAIVALVLHALLGWPSHVITICALASIAVPVALSLSSSTRTVGSVGTLFAHTVSLTGLTGVVGVVYFVIVLGLGRAPHDEERTLLLLSMIAAAVAALLYLPARERFTAFANNLVYGQKRAPDEALRTFGGHLSRAVPLDELLLQLAESLRKNLGLVRAEVWTGSDGSLERTVSDPEAEKARLSLSDAEVAVVARAGVSGNAWVEVWLPDLLAGRAGTQLRVAPITHSGELLGLIVAERDGEEHFADEEDRVLTELSRQVGQALHNVHLDSALQASLDELRRQADELRASRTRIVAATDAERRRIERDLHDGAQQHLVALAVRLRLAEQLSESDKAKAILEELRGNLQDAIQELRDFAHGIYPPLLMDRGLGEALSAAASRAALPTVVKADGIGRYPQDIESAIYFCCLEALQNAAKYAGEGAHATVSVREEEGGLVFEVSDDGQGFDVNERSIGAGFTNMMDRLGAIGGKMRVESTPGSGTRLSGVLPLTG
jgi:signal transduction histidine kinase